jgi:oligosaccharide repeat unit polymerase
LAVFDPRVFFLLLWGSQMFGYLFRGDQFYPFEIRTWLVFLFGVAGYFIGSSLALTRLLGPSPAIGPMRAADSHEQHLVRRFFRVAQLLYLVGCGFAVAQIISVLGAEALFSGDLAGLRMSVVNDFVGDRELFSSIRVFYFGVGLSVFQLAHAKYFGSGERVAVMLLGLLSALATTGRLYLLLFVLASAFLLSRQRLASRRAVGFLLVAFVLLFFSFALLLEKGSDEGSVFAQIVWNLQVYLLSSLACFNDYVATGVQETPGGILIPNALRDLIRIMGISMAEKPNLLPFAMVPIQCNTYTVLFPLYHDVGTVGVLLGLAAIGWFNTFIWLKQSMTPSPLLLFTYAITLYPLAMSMFEDAYFSSPGFWVMLWALPAILSIVLRVFGANKPTRRPVDARDTRLAK